MRIFAKILLVCLYIGFGSDVFAKRIVNLYLSGALIPQKLILNFQKESGIQVNLSTYDSNETMYAKMHATQKNIYDVIAPSSYYVERMKRYGLLTQLDKSKLPNLKNLDPFFQNNDFDPNNAFHVPLVWGITGIFYNQQLIKNPPQSWSDLWRQDLKNQLMLLDDMRDVFAISFLSLGYAPNETDPLRIKQAYEHLLHLVPNIKLFAYDAITSLIIDEDANIGASWNGDVVKAQAENPRIRFVFPKDGILLWIDCLAIPATAPHPEEAYAFINFLLRPENAAQIVLEYGYSVTNQASLEFLPESIRTNPYIFPDKQSLKPSYYQRDLGEDVLDLYNAYWEKLKLAC